MIRAGIRKPIQNSLVLPAHVVEQLYDEDAERLLEENARTRRS